MSSMFLSVPATVTPGEQFEALITADRLENGLSGLNIVLHHDNRVASVNAVGLGAFSNLTANLSHPAAGYTYVTLGGNLVEGEITGPMLSITFNVDDEAELGICNIDIVNSGGGHTTTLTDQDFNDYTMVPPGRLVIVDE